MRGFCHIKNKPANTIVHKAAPANSAFLENFLCCCSVISVVSSVSRLSQTPIQMLDRPLASPVRHSKMVPLAIPKRGARSARTNESDSFRPILRLFVGMSDDKSTCPGFSLVREHERIIHVSSRPFERRSEISIDTIASVHPEVS